MYFLGATYPFDLNVFIHNSIKLLSKNIILFTAISIIYVEFIFLKKISFIRNKFEKIIFFSILWINFINFLLSYNKYQRRCFRQSHFFNVNFYDFNSY